MNKILMHIICLMFCLIPLNSYSEEAPALFKPVQGQVRVQAIGSKLEQQTVVRERVMAVDFSLLPGPAGKTGRRASQEEGHADGSAKGLANSRLKLNLFEDLAVTLVIDEIRDESPDGATISIIGHLEGFPGSQAILVSSGSILAGNLSLPGYGLFHIRYLGDNNHAIRQIDQRGYPREKDPANPQIKENDLSVATDEQSSSEAESAESADDPPGSSADESGSVIDAMVVYTPAARAAVGGTNAMIALIDLAVTETNTGYSNSGIVQRINLVHRAEVSYTEATFDDPFDIALDDLTGTSDGKMDNVHTMRDDYGADMVSLFIDDTTWCGLAWIMTDESHDFQDHAFSVVHWDCATGYYSFAHEMGHNQGGKHDRPTDNSDGVFSYSHGYQDPEGDFRTIMSYDCPGGCTRVNYWSNPDIDYVDGGINYGPMGVVYTASDSADMRRSHNFTRDTVANWRPRYVYVDKDWTGTETGLSANPFNTISEGVDKIGRFATGARLYITPGFYSGSGNYPLIITKPMTIYPWGSGAITIVP